MAPEVSFRPATRADAAALAVLVDIAGEGMPAYMWSTLAAPGQSLLELGRERAGRDSGGGFSWKNAVVAEVDGEVAASLVGYRLDDPYDLDGLAEIPPVVQPLVKLEARAPGSWYVNVLATFPEFRGLGIATTLLEIAESNASDAEASALSVIVASWNEAAERLYRRAGYEAVATEPAIPFPGCPYTGDWVLMVKSLANGA
ncbi:MAG TPA: GNAT family N-acetyltransferase [Methyloceanibacter sp.]|jgi:ribosomal protein S18 acetylase RimI-like enzyme|nr:GNAT family N-acetyltransferase [Methyloceanibacter sp.]